MQVTITISIYSANLHVGMIKLGLPNYILSLQDCFIFTINIITFSTMFIPT